MGKICLGWALGLTLLAACGSDADARFATAQATLHTMLRSYGVEQLNEAALAKQIREGDKFTLQNPDDFRSCFADYRGPADEGLAGFVFGRIAPRKDSLLLDAKKDRIDVYFRAAPKTKPVAVLVRVDKEWKFSLKQSVPPELRDRLLALYRSAEESRRRGGSL